jgi:glycosyltransferase involved in cell wall biosynthesis
MILGLDCSRYAAEKPTGVETYTDRVVDGIIARADLLGFKELRCYVRSAIQVEQLLYKIEKFGQKTVKVKLIERKNLWTLVWLSWEMIRAPVDLLFVPSHTLPFFIPRYSLMTVHGLEALLFPQAYTVTQRLYQRFSIWWGKVQGTKLVAVSEAVKKDLLKFFVMGKDRIQVVYNGFDRVETNEKSPPVEETKPMIEGDYILNVARLEERKNQLRLIQAFEAIAVEFPELKLVLVGPDGMGAVAIHAAVEKSAVKDRIVVPGYQHRETVQGLMEHAKVFAYPSLAEGFGIPILEAFDAGTPVLTSKGSAMEEIGADAAVYVDPLSVESIAAGLKSLLTDKSLVKKNVESGKKRMELFSWEHCVEGTVAVLKSFFVEKTSP